MSDSGFESKALIGIVSASVGFIGAQLIFDTKDEMREQAVNCGCAEWVVDARGKTEFVWKCEEPEAEDE